MAVFHFGIIHLVTTPLWGNLQIAKVQTQFWYCYIRSQKLMGSAYIFDIFAIVAIYLLYIFKNSQYKTHIYFSLPPAIELVNILESDVKITVGLS